MTADRRSLLDALAETDAELVMDIDTTEVKRRAALVERVSTCFASDTPALDIETAIDLIRAEVLEEAARVAEREGVYPELNIAAGGPEWYRHGKRIAAAIRALKEKP